MPAMSRCQRCNKRVADPNERQMISVGVASSRRIFALAVQQSRIARLQSEIEKVCNEYHGNTFALVDETVGDVPLRLMRTD
jgi:hypothetical protein